MTERKFWRATEFGVGVIHAWGSPMRLILETPRFVGPSKKKQFYMDPTDALHLAERIYSAYGCSGLASPNWRTRYPDVYPDFEPRPD